MQSFFKKFQNDMLSVLLKLLHSSQLAFTVQSAKFCLLVQVDRNAKLIKSLMRICNQFSFHSIIYINKNFIVIYFILFFPCWEKKICVRYYTPTTTALNVLTSVLRLRIYPHCHAVNILIHIVKSTCIIMYIHKANIPGLWWLMNLAFVICLLNVELAKFM